MGKWDTSKNVEKERGKEAKIRKNKQTGKKMFHRKNGHEKVYKISQSETQ